jgi:4-hydroxy-3-methylbut-2-enyl diphosphate reductase
VKALSIRQPWAWLVVNGWKNIENRERRFSHRGPLLIHAAAWMTPADYEACRIFVDGICDDLAMPALEDLPRGGIVVFSAHGVSQEVRRDAEARGLQVYDATCPLVTKVHLEVVKMCKEGFTVLMIGHAGHPEVEGTMGQVGQGIVLIEDLEDVAKLNLPADEKVAFVTQTTLSVDETKEIVDALTKKFPHISKPRKQDICYATQNRQDAVKFMAPQVDLVIVVGSKASSNSNRLRELSEKLGVPSYMVDAPEQLEEKWFEGKKRIGLTAGASAPESLAQSIVARIQEFGPRQIRSLPGVVEDVTFSLPKNLTN